ncbi:MAG TPA: recombinase family protein [Gemmataceae bacterium]|jgi:DNA invertase Pin-like site-specific DNA recombinase
MNPNKPTDDGGVAYLRVSDPHKQDWASQRRIIQSWLDKHGLRVSLWLEDGGSRDVAYKRPEFQRLLKLVEEGRVRWIVVDAQDRFGVSNNWELGKFICHLRENNCELWSVSQGCLSSDDAFTSLMAAVGSVQSKHEQLDKAQRSIRGKIAQAKAGEFTGGTPPYGHDVCCVGPDGQERWRVYYESRYQRVQIWPEGRRVRFDGKGNFPARNSGEKLRLTPSIDAERVAMARKIFQWLATEAINVYQLCRRLNALGISPVIGKAWYPTRLIPQLQNPVYLIGCGVWNKRGFGRHLEWKDGEYSPVPKVNDRAKTGRKRAADQYIYPDQTGQGIIDQETFDKVQAKLAAGPRRESTAPRNSGLWLSGLIYCGHCDGVGASGGRMMGWHAKDDKACPYSYTCPSYRHYGPANATGCRLHRVNQKVIEKLLEQYLDEAGTSLQALLDVTAGDDAEDILTGLLHEEEGKRLSYLRELTRLWREVRDSGARPPAGQPWAVGNLLAAYRSQARRRRVELNKQLAAKEAELDRLVEQYAGLRSEMARERANRKMEAMEQEILGLREQIAPLDARVEGLHEELMTLEQRIAEAREALAGDSNRRKAQAIRTVIRRIVCKFQHVQAGSLKRSVLTEVRIEPVEGATIVVSTGHRPSSPRPERPRPRRNRPPASTRAPPRS